ncbi:hypothetical protein GCM10009530_45250 [Microbispora corallina]|uniref:Uncharacterized protein n=1 Tax=Microbispora corallina TaxID=83302 RepID=A0ABQ4FWN5_9ACTN|nr:hypothetical protein [Microbispora corallina]GIH39217.1 hypothetical protein Mco01_22170 [Microbispora corallina]
MAHGDETAGGRGAGGEIPDRLPPLAQSPDAQPEGDPEGGASGDWHAPGADSADDVDEPYDE